MCRSICAEERAQILDPLMGSKYPTTYLMVFVFFLFHCICCSQNQMPFSSIWDMVLRTSADDSEASHPRRRVRSKRTFKMKKVWGADEVDRFLVIGATDAAGKPSYFYCRICHKDVSVLTHGPHEVLRHFQGVKQFARDKRLRLETPGLRVLDFKGNPFTESEFESRRESILRGLLVIRDRENPFAEDLIVDDSGAPYAKLPVLAKVSSLVEVLHLGGSYELLHQLWSQFILTASRVNIDVTWSRNKVLVGNFCFQCLRMHVHWLIAAVF